MDKKNPNIYQRALDIVNHRINPDIPQGGGESAPEVENAIETHGLGWTSEEEIPAIDITWDGNTEDREHFPSADVTYVKVADAIFNDISELYGAKIVCASEEVILDDNNCLYDEGYYILNYFGIYLPIDGEDISAGLYFLKARNYYTSSLTKEATTEEVVHQIDQKYIPGGSGGAGTVFVNLYMDPVSEVDPIVSDKTLLDLQSLINSGATIIAKLSLGDSQTIFWPLIQYYEADGVPGEAYFGYPIYNSTTDSSSPVLMARLLTEDGDTEWICTIFN